MSDTAQLHDPIKLRRRVRALREVIDWPIETVAGAMKLHPIIVRDWLDRGTNDALVADRAEAWCNRIEGEVKVLLAHRRQKKTEEKEGKK